ncbi:unnamed protein product [Cladocopium goreaui]|uniref:Uncharacterized protein n=1 Tax=Cladocopium goreaui TaxID=2562237 RepID=A0A9P1CV57_9DINO|nr:unnamed protein product [Cladocopium goreaui]
MAKEYPTCIFPDILDLVSDPPKKDNWVPANLKLVNAASCVKHNGECRLKLEETELGVVGAPCVLFSAYGLREGFATKNVDVKHAHDVSMKFQQSTPVSVHENVPNYDEARLCPRQFGHPNRRLRVWRILFDKETKKWSADRSLGELANLILAPIETKPELDFNAYLWASPNELEGKAVKEEDLTRTQQKHLRLFREARPDKSLYDLSANPMKRCRTETVDNCLPCLTTSSQLWSEKAKRLMLGKEQLHALGFPCSTRGAAAARTDAVGVDYLSEAALRSISGNGMSLPCAGFILLMTVLCVSDRC